MPLSLLSKAAVFSGGMISSAWRSVAILEHLQPHLETGNSTHRRDPFTLSKFKTQHCLLFLGTGKRHKRNEVATNCHCRSAVATNCHCPSLFSAQWGGKGKMTIHTALLWKQNQDQSEWEHLGRNKGEFWKHPLPVGKIAHSL